MRIGLFGGAFNPPHTGHLVVAESARVSANLDKVLWIPTGRPPHKPPTPFAPPSDRIEMVERAINGNPYFEVSTVEVERPGPSYMVETIGILKDQNPNDDFLLIIGGDSLAAFHTWFRYGEILRQAQIVVFERSETVYDDVEEQIMAKVQWVPAPPVIDVSSSDVRRRIASGLSIRYLVPESVEHYIRRRNLYAA